MLWGSALVALAVVLLLAQYRWLAVVAYCLFGLSLAFYATPFPEWSRRRA